MSRTGTDTISKVKIVVKRPKLFKVILHNDDYTSMDFVVEILKSVFGKSLAEAENIMKQVHYQGAGICGVYPYEVAEAKVSLVYERAKEAGFPLRTSMEAE